MSHNCSDQCVCRRHATPVRFEYEEWYGQHQCPRESEHGPITLYDADPTLRDPAFTALDKPGGIE